MSGQDGKLFAELLEKVRQADLVPYLIRRGEQLKQEGSEYRVLNYGGLMVKGCKWHWWSAGKSGKAVDFLVEVYGLTLAEAVEELLQCSPASEQSLSSGQVNVSVSSQNGLKMPSRACNDKRVIAYLCKRGIDYSVVIGLLKANKLYQDCNGNCCFVMQDWKGSTIGAELHGTGDTRFKQSTRHTCHGFYLVCGNPLGAMFFESAIDLLSYYQLYKSSLKHHLLFSMAGLNDSAVFEYHRSNPEKKICICCDNGQSGDDFIERIKKSVPDVLVHRPSGLKDWNEALTKKVS